jgi:hypothetical protein
LNLGETGSGNLVGQAQVVIPHLRVMEVEPHDFFLVQPGSSGRILDGQVRPPLGKEGVLGDHDPGNWVNPGLLELIEECGKILDPDLIDGPHLVGQGHTRLVTHVSRRVLDIDDEGIDLRPTRHLDEAAPTPPGPSGPSVEVDAPDILRPGETNRGELVPGGGITGIGGVKLLVRPGNGSRRFRLRKGTALRVYAGLKFLQLAGFRNHRCRFSVTGRLRRIRFTSTVPFLAADQKEDQEEEPSRSHQYLGRVGSTWARHPITPPCRFRTLIYPISIRRSVAQALLGPDRQYKTISAV